jgi:uncharacterized protein YbaA (DUF1428 family)
MTYVEGFVVAVPAENKDAYRTHAAEAEPLFKEFGVTRMVEAWGDDIPEGKVTDFRGSVQAKEGEAVVFSWFEYPSREARDAANAKMMSDPRMKEMGASMPFDGQRMIMGGFESLLDEGGDARGGYIDGFIVPVPEVKKEAYREIASKVAPIFQDCGALRVVEAWGDDVPEGKVTDYRRAVKAVDGENVVFSWVEWPSKAARDEGWAKFMADERMKSEEGKDVFDGQRMFWGGFEPILDR